jgi:hypothetical protein
MPDAPYVLSAHDKREFLETMKSIKIPTGYVSNLHQCISGGKMSGLKSHNYHVLIQ